MNKKLDELAKGLAQSVTRRQALRRFGVGLAGMALACFGLADWAEAGKKPLPCACLSDSDCSRGDYCSGGLCVPTWCDPSTSCCCYCGKHGPAAALTALPSCSPVYTVCQSHCGGLLIC